MLMEYKTEADKWVFQMVAPTGTGSFEATFANTSERETLATNAALRIATWVIMRLFAHYGVDLEEIGDFFAATFNSRDVTTSKS